MVDPTNANNVVPIGTGTKSGPEVSPLVNPNTSYTTPSVLSSSAGADIVGKKTQTLNQLSPVPTTTAPSTTTTTPTKTETPPPTQTKVTLINPNTEQTVTFDNADINKENIQAYVGAGYQMSDASGQIPSWMTPNGVSTAPQTPEQKMQAGVDQAATDLKSLTDNLTKFTVSDADLASQVSGISAQWDARIADMNRINAQRKGSISTLGVRLGDRYAGGSGGQFGGIISEEERQGVSRVAELEGQKQSAIAAAKAAAMAQNWSVYSKQVDLAEKAYTQKVAAMKDLQKATADQNKVIADQLAADKKATYEQVTKPINDVITNASKNGAPKDVIDAINGSENVADAVKAAGNYLQDVPTGGIVGEYLFYKKQAETSGKTPVDFNTYQNIDANRKEKASGATAATNPNRVLSVAEAQALGKPFGTTAKDAYGTIPQKPATEGQTKASAYADRMVQAAAIVKNLESDIVNMNPAAYATAKMAENTTIGNAFVPDSVRQVRQAQRNFITAVLRQESGASISPTEFANDEKKYFPQPGDDPATLKNKEAARAAAIKGLIKESGTAYQGTNLTGDELAQTDQAAQQTVIQYGTDHPESRDQIKSLLTEVQPELGRPLTYAEVLQVVNGK